jgi:hypothetical protein
MPRVIYVKPHRRGKAVVKAHKRSILKRIQSIADRHQRASREMNKLPGPSTGIYGTGLNALDKRYSQTASVMDRAGKVANSKWRRLYAKARKRSNKKFPY